MYLTSRLVEERADTYGALGVATALLFSLYLVGRLIVGAIRQHMYHYESSWTDAAVRRFVREAVRRLLDEAVAHVRGREGPALLRLTVPRLQGHSFQQVHFFLGVESAAAVRRSDHQHRDSHFAANGGC